MERKRISQCLSLKKNKKTTVQSSLSYFLTLRYDSKHSGVFHISCDVLFSSPGDSDSRLLSSNITNRFILMGQRVISVFEYLRRPSLQTLFRNGWHLKWRCQHLSYFFFFSSSGINMKCGAPQVQHPDAILHVLRVFKFIVTNSTDGGGGDNKNNKW